ncbi:MAG TPA: flavoprotein [Planctomycetota bacterium]|nr:flavoprotein [Planctomycetota bacterium]
MANVLLGVSAGIAAYKAVDLASKLTQRGDSVRTLLTPNATRFITPLTFRAVTGERVFTEALGGDPDADMEHIRLSEWADLLLVAPATADVIARLAAGLADDILTTTALAFSKPVLIAPAMNDHMWAHPLLQANLRRLVEVAGYRIVEPGSGHLACGSYGPARLPETADLIAAIDRALTEATSRAARPLEA